MEKVIKEGRERQLRRTDREKITGTKGLIALGNQRSAAVERGKGRMDSVEREMEVAKGKRLEVKRKG